MRWSNLFIPTLREDPADAEAVSHRLLVRGGYIRQLHAGHYSLLPLGLRVHQKIEQIIREEMEGIGAQEFLLPAMHPAALWQRSGRWELMGDEMFRLQDRKGADLALGMTHEEVFSHLSVELNSYKDLPQIWYQIQWKFRDEPRPKAGLLRVREFAMKDSYSFDLDEAGLDHSFDLHHDAYVRIFDRLSLPAFGVQASSGAMGGSGSIEFMVPSPAGEDDVARCPSCGYSANVERARARLAPVVDPEPPAQPERFETPGVVTIAALEEFPGGAAANRQIKSLMYLLDGDFTIVLMRGDHQLNLQKLQDSTGAVNVRAAEPEEILERLGARPGSLGAVGVSGFRIVADHALEGRTSMTTGANTDGWHLRGVDVARDIAVDQWADLRQVEAGEPCIDCGTPIEVLRCIEAGHIFKLGRKYSEAMGATVLDAEGHQRTVIMGSYGIGVGRALAGIAETHADEKGLVWPVEVAPYHVVITALKYDDPVVARAADALYDELRAGGLDVLLDDRDERPGVKFADADLIGIPYRITVGPKGVAAGEVELLHRARGDKYDLPVGAVLDEVRAAIN